MNLKLKPTLNSLILISSLSCGFSSYLRAEDASVHNELQKTALLEADAVLKEKLETAVISLGWERELIEVNFDLTKFVEKHQEFKALFQVSALAILSEELSRAQDTESLLYSSAKGAAYVATGAAAGAALVGGLSAVAVITSLGALASIGIVPALMTALVGLVQFGGPIVATGVGAAGAILGGGLVLIPVLGAGLVHAGKKLGHGMIWGHPIELTEQLSDTYLDKSKNSAFLYCRNLKKPTADGWIDKDIDKEGNTIKGSWAYEGEKSVFATQEDPIDLLTRCAKLMQHSKGIARMSPNDIIPTVGVSVMHTNTLYDYYKIVYFTKATNRNGKASMLTSFLSK